LEPPNSLRGIVVVMHRGDLSLQQSFRIEIGVIGLSGVAVMEVKEVAVRLCLASQKQCGSLLMQVAGCEAPPTKSHRDGCQAGLSCYNNSN